MWAQGNHHPSLTKMVTNWDVKKSRSRLKFLSGNYLTYKVKADQSGGSPRCRICETGAEETVSHVISNCSGLQSERQKILPDISKLCNLTQNIINFEELLQSEEKLCQFILDPTSLNLTLRVNLQDKLVPAFFQLSRDFCHVMDKTRLRLLKELAEKT